MEPKKQPRLDIDLGDELHGWITREAATRSMPRAQLVRDLIVNGRLHEQALIESVRLVVRDLAAAVTNDGSHDPADDDRAAVPLSRLASLIGSAPAALGVLAALQELADRELRS